jgi:hypothetical protein
LPIGGSSIVILVARRFCSYSPDRRSPLEAPRLVRIGPCVHHVLADVHVEVDCRSSGPSCPAGTLRKKTRGPLTSGCRRMAMARSGVGAVDPTDIGGGLGGRSSTLCRRPEDWLDCIDVAEKNRATSHQKRPEVAREPGPGQASKVTWKGVGHNAATPRGVLEHVGSFRSWPATIEEALGARSAYADGFAYRSVGETRIPASFVRARPAFSSPRGEDHRGGGGGGGRPPRPPLGGGGGGGGG